MVAIKLLPNEDDEQTKLSRDVSSRAQTTRKEPPAENQEVLHNAKT